MLRQLRIHRKIIQDISVSLLEPLPGFYQRLNYLASLRDPGNGRYMHLRLTAIYTEQAVQEALAKCHEEIFERILETPLELQEKDLRRYLEALPEGFSGGLETWQKPGFERGLLPDQEPEYLKELFRSNLRVLLKFLREDCSLVH